MIQPVILCGGSGTRLWPLSREHHPKPLHALNGSQTLLQETAARCRGVASIGEPLLVCNEAHRFMVQAQLARIGAKPKAILLEPKGRGTAPALTLAAIHAVTSDDPVLLAMPSDHFIRDRAAFQRAVERGAAAAQQGHMVTFGVPPTAPETGYGYITVGKSNFLEAFVEKPDLDTAREYLASGRYLWNSGIFAVRASVWLDAIASFRKDIFAPRQRPYRHGQPAGPVLRVGQAAFRQRRPRS